MEAWNLHEVDAPKGTRDPIVLYSGAEGRAVMIRLDPGQRLGDHQVKERAWLSVVEGEVEIGVGDGRPEVWRAGTLATFDPDERHSISSPGGARILLLLAPWPGLGHYRGHERTAEPAP